MQSSTIIGVPGLQKVCTPTKHFPKSRRFWQKLLTKLIGSEISHLNLPKPSFLFKCLKSTMKILMQSA